MVFELPGISAIINTNEGNRQKWVCVGKPMSDDGRHITIADYQQALARMSREELELMAKSLSDRLQTLSPSGSQRSILDLEGLGAGVWRGLDAQDYVNHERDSWTS